MAHGEVGTLYSRIISMQHITVTLAGVRWEKVEATERPWWEALFNVWMRIAGSNGANAFTAAAAAAAAAAAVAVAVAVACMSGMIVVADDAVVRCTSPAEGS
jgi:type IV secretory pathway TraG/TraD family ATPase VirD4